MALLHFQTSVATALLLAGKEPKQQRGRPSLTPPPKKKTKAHSSPTPVNDVRYDGIGHLPDFSDKKQCLSLVYVYPSCMMLLKCNNCKIS